MAQKEFTRKRKIAKLDIGRSQRKAAGAARTSEAPARAAPTQEILHSSGPLYGLGSTALAWQPDDVSDNADPQHPESLGKERAEHAIENPPPGERLDPVMRQRMEQHFGRNFGDVEVHTGPMAEEATVALDARALTHRQHIWLGPHVDKSDTKSMAHELAHVAQQGHAPPRQRGAHLSLVGGSSKRSAPARNQPGATAPAKSSGGVGQRLDLWGAVRSVGGAVSSGVRSVARGAAGVVEGVMDMGRDALMAVVRRVAPDFARLFERDGIRGFLSDMVGRGLRTLFGGPMAAIRRIFNFGGISERFRRVANWFVTIGGQLARNDCSGVTEAAQRFREFMSTTFEPVIEKVRDVSSSISEFFGSIWDAVGAPIMDLLRRIGGTVWESIRGFISDIGGMLRRVKEALGGAWDQVKEWFGIGAEEGTEEGGGLWNWIKDKAVGVWDSVKGPLQPVMGPLRTVGTVLALISPAGPVLAVIAAWPHLRRAFNWVRERWNDLNLFVRARRFMSNTVLPAVIGAARRIGNALLGGADWILGLLGRVAGAVEGVGGRLSGGLLAPLGRIISFMSQRFQSLVTWARDGLRFVATNAHSLIQKLIEFIQPIIDALRRLIAIAVNPFGITGFLMGNLWKILPDCLKGPIIDFILDVIIRFLRSIPPLFSLGILWPFIRNAALGFLERIRSFTVERKVNVSNKMANIVSGGSPSFAFGYLKGIVIGLWNGITGPFQAIIAIFELPGMIRQFLSSLGLRLCELMAAIRCFASSITERAIGTFSMLMEAAGDLLSNPSRIIELIRCGIESALDAVGSIGSSIADQMMELFEGPDEKIGDMLGRLTGSFLVDAVLAFFTAGASTATSVIRQVASVLRTVGRNMMRVLRVVGRLVPKFLKFIKKIGGIFRRAGSGAGSALGRIGRFFRRIANWFKKLLTRVGRRFRRGRGRGRNRSRRNDRRVWGRFRTAVFQRLSQVGERGIRRERLRTLFRSIRGRYPTVVRSSLRPIRRDEAFWELFARRRGRPISQRVGRVLMDRDTRWDEGKKAIKRLVRRIKRRPGNIDAGDLQQPLRRIRRQYHYRTLSVRYENEKNNFNVRGSMSNTDSVGAFPPELSNPNDFDSTSSGAEIDNLAYKHPRTPATGDPHLWGEISRIRSRRDSTRYIRGHLVAGWFAHGRASNLTPITRNANGDMARKFETPLRKSLPWESGLRDKLNDFVPQNRLDEIDVYHLKVEKLGTASRQPPLRRIKNKPNDAPERVSAEADLAHEIKMTLTKKKYVGNNWTLSSDAINVTGLNNGHISKNVPNDEKFSDNGGYPKGDVRPKPSSDSSDQ